ncbi:hypothetical protein FQA39_LY08778 [Lamprigera yunnana]|nr:hypothetical protein FQA39_LY08778 [Lamprigera yunnana]
MIACHTLSSNVIAQDIQAVEGKSVSLACEVTPPGHDKVYMVFWFQYGSGIPIYSVRSPLIIIKHLALCETLYGSLIYNKPEDCRTDYSHFYILEGPLKTYFNEEVSTCLKSHPERVVTHFQKTGLWPFDPDIFPDYLLEPAETTNIPMQQGQVEPEKDSTATENLSIISLSPSQVEVGNSTSLTIASKSAADNPRPLSAAPM